jgi:RNA polymerase sigma factor (sigma-70 family)
VSRASSLLNGHASENGNELDGALIERVQRYLVLCAERRDPEPLLRESWMKFYGCLAPRLLSVARACVRPGEDPQDLVQEIWKVLVVRLRRFAFDSARGSMQNWLRVVAQHVLIDHARVGRDPPSVRLSEQLAGCLPSREPDPALACQAHENRLLVRQGLEALKEHASHTNYELIHQHWIGDRTLAAIAGDLGLTSKQARKRHARALQELHELLRPRSRIG